MPSICAGAVYAVVLIITVALLQDEPELAVAATAGSLTRVKAALMRGADPNYGYTGLAGTVPPLFTATVTGSVEIISAFLEAGADPNAREMIGPFGYGTV